MKKERIINYGIQTLLYLLNVYICNNKSIFVLNAYLYRLKL